MEQSTETAAKLRRRMVEAIESAWAPEDGKAIENAADAAMGIALPELERLQAALVEAQREASGLRRENVRLGEENTRRKANAESDVCTGCMQREQQRDHWADVSRQNGIKYEQMKQACNREQDRARQAETERDRARQERDETHRKLISAIEGAEEAWRIRSPITEESGA